MSDFTIVTVTSPDVENQLVFNSNQVAIEFSFGSAWNDIIIGFRLYFDDLGTNIVGNPIMAFGLLANPAVGIPNGVQLGALTSNFRGKLSGTGPVDFTRTAGPPARYAHTMNDVISFNGTTTSTDSANYIRSATPNIRTAQVIRFQRSGGNISVTATTLVNASGLVDISFATLVAAIQTGTNAGALALLNAAAGGAFYQTTATVSKAVDEVTYGFFNSFLLSWQQGDNNGLSAMHVSDLVFKRSS